MMMSKAVSHLCFMLIAVILARSLPPVEFGTFNQVWLVNRTMIYLFALGLPVSVYYFLPRLPAAKTKGFILQTMLGLGFLAPAWAERWGSFDRQGGEWIRHQRVAEATDGFAIRSLVEEARARGPGRIYAGNMLKSSCRNFKLGMVGMCEALLGYNADVIGFLLRTPSLSTDFEANFDDTNPAQYDLFDVRYVILPSGREPSVPATLIEQQNGNALWEVPTSGYLAVVDTVPPPITANRLNLYQQGGFFLQSDLLPQGRYPTIAFAGEPAATPTLIGAGQPPGPAGSIQFEHDALADGEVVAQVTANRPAMVILKSSFDPRWEVIVDGVTLAPQMVAPSFVGRTIPAGRHSIVFRYKPFPRYDLLFALGALTFVGLWFGPQILTRRRKARRSVPEEGWTGGGAMEDGLAEVPELEA